MRANCGARVTRRTALIMPPENDDHTPMPSASPGWPLRAMGKPSKVVATEEGVPGMPVRMPAMSPPERPPTRTLTMVASPCGAGMPKVNGKVSTTAIAMVKPGMAPAIKPPATPRSMRARVVTFVISPKAAMMLSRITKPTSGPSERRENLARR